MRNDECVQFLQWCLPKRQLRWSGFRRVRRIVCKRIDRRLKELGLSSINDYCAYLEDHPAEWVLLDTFCRIPISRFYRDRAVFQFLEKKAPAELSSAAVARGERVLRCWSIGCASGEEPYSLSILWRKTLAPRFSSLAIRILATDAEPEMIQRAERGCYKANSLKDLPEDWKQKVFEPSGDLYCIKSAYRKPVTFLLQDIRERIPHEWFHFILCRYLVFTYFDEALQRKILREILDHLVPGGVFLIGNTEDLPGGNFGLEPWSAWKSAYQKPFGC
ncbi:MAG: CheR family methyltransferase [Nitrospiria bacterium]